MRPLLLGLIGGLAYAGAAFAGDDGACLVARHLVYTETSLSRVAAAIDKQRALAIVVLGTGSSTLPGPTGAQAAYPARLEAALVRRLPGVTVKVTPVIKQRSVAAEMSTPDVARTIMDAKPDLVIWQTGTVDALRGVDPEEFRDALDGGVEMLNEKGTDVILMNMQYSPRTELMIAGAAYADNIRWVALQREVPLFDRFAIMKHWSELGTFDLYMASKNTDTAERVHDCIGQLLAELIIESAKPAVAATPGEIR